MRLFVRRLGSAASVAIAITIAVTSCLDDPSGPGVQSGFLSLAPSFESSAAGIVDVGSVHVILVRAADESVALDTVVTLETGSDSVDLSFSVLVSSAN